MDNLKIFSKLSFFGIRNPLFKTLPIRTVRIPANVKRYPANNIWCRGISGINLKHLIADLNAWKRTSPQCTTNQCAKPDLCGLLHDLRSFFFFHDLTSCISFYDSYQFFILYHDCAFFNQKNRHIELTYSSLRVKINVCLNFNNLMFRKRGGFLRWIFKKSISRNLYLQMKL